MAGTKRAFTIFSAQDSLESRPGYESYIPDFPSPLGQVWNVDDEFSETDSLGRSSSATSTDSHKSIGALSSIPDDSDESPVKVIHPPIGTPRGEGQVKIVTKEPEVIPDSEPELPPLQRCSSLALVFQQAAMELIGVRTPSPLFSDGEREQADAYGLPLGTDQADSPQVALHHAEPNTEPQVYEPHPFRPALRQTVPNIELQMYELPSPQPSQASRHEASDTQIQVYKPPLHQHTPFEEQTQVPSIPRPLNPLHVGPLAPLSVVDNGKIAFAPVHHTNTVENVRTPSYVPPARYVTSPTEPYFPQLPFSVSFDPNRGRARLALPPSSSPAEGSSSLTAPPRERSVSPDGKP
ncbi:hypothetical protein EDB81DRAFT_932661 [Dactylonectria macrodidyma]|uniref:Uncharacterized protein n=1 Tax=Dactylonectria macrodidyma TaxID=307937 RepID=A0A9P9J3C0_9HYPO|nr:hypothetical protein EDB81DRAFT_932661 [Dactylonectria macrodidyma]